MELTSHVYRVYKKLDKTINRFQSATNINCIKECGICCRNWWVEATILEVLPVANEIYVRHMEDELFSSIQEKDGREDVNCVLFVPDTLHEENGSCAYYEWRPLICRLFGFAARRDKNNQIDWATCKIIKNRIPNEIQRAKMGISAGLKIPVYQDAFFRIASLHPGMGYQRFPINQALKKALEYLYWLNPGGTGWKKASNY